MASNTKFSKFCDRAASVVIEDWIVRRIARRRSRRALNALTDAQLADIGLSRSEIARIIRRQVEIDRLDSQIRLPRKD